jgi:trigger factor
VKVTVESMPESSVELDIAADEQEFSDAKERAYRRISQNVRVPGFRPGKAPRPLIEQRIGHDTLVVEAQREIMEDLYRRAIQQESILPVSEPEIAIYQDEPFAFKARIQVYPSAKLGDYRSLRMEPRPVEIADADVDAAIEEIRERAGVWVEPAEPREPKEGDQITIDLQAFQGGEPYREPLTDGTFIVGEGQLFADIETEVKRLRPGESTEFEVTFDENDEMINPELRGKSLRYNLTLKEVKEQELPEVNDELAKTAGEFETLDELKEVIQHDLLYNRTLETRSQVISEIIDAVAEDSQVDIPPVMVSRQIDEEMDRLKRRLQMQRTTLDEYLRFVGQTPEEFTKELRPEAERRVRNLLIIEAIAAAEGIKVSDDEILAQINNLVAHAKEPDEIKKIYSSPHYQGMIEEELRQQKVTDRLLDVVTEGRGPVAGEGAEALRQLLEPPTETTEVADAESDVHESGGEQGETDQAEDHVTPAVAAEAKPEQAEDTDQK